MGKNDCVFCEIIQGSTKASVVWENDLVIAILDHRQANPGHVLVIPKGHFADIYSLSDEAGAAIMKAVIALSQAVQKAFEPDGLSIWQSNGPGAHQEVPHVHFHIHPRKIDDGLLRVYPSRPNYPPREEMDRYAERIRGCL